MVDARLVGRAVPRASPVLLDLLKALAEAAPGMISQPFCAQRAGEISGVPYPLK